MKSTRRLRPSRIAAAIACAACAWIAGAAILPNLVNVAATGQLMTCVYQLQPGWNAVYLEVRPEPDDLPTVFAGLPIQSVFTRSAQAFAAEFIQDPGEDLIHDPGWRWYFPDAPQSVTNTLYAVQANRAYLIQASAAAAWSVTGRPRIEPIRWAPDAYTLTGLPVEPNSPPTFEAFFAASPAHVGQAVYRLDNPSAAWQPVGPGTPIRSGEAYWVHTKGASSYTGPIGVNLSSIIALDYRETIDELDLKLTNLAPDSRTLSVRKLASESPVPLARRTFVTPLQTTDPEAPPVAVLQWPDLPDLLELELDAGQTASERYAVQRSRFPAEADTVESVLEITDGLGTRRLLPVIASRPGTAEAAAFAASEGLLRRVGRAIGESLDSEPAHPGLWIGHAQIQQVNNAQSGLASLQPVSRPFHFRLILHVDHADQARLLQQVIQMWQNGVTAPDGTLESGGNYVLLTDDTLIPGFAGAALQDGTQVGRRISTVGYNLAQPALDMDGGFDFGGALDVTIAVDANHPTNPFKHRFHPDHDGLDATYAAPSDEVFSYERRITLSFADRDPELADPNAPNPPGWGDSVMGGGYREVIPALYSPNSTDPDRVLVSGIHRNDVVAEGIFRLTRASLVDELNPDPQ